MGSVKEDHGTQQQAIALPITDLEPPLGWYVLSSFYTNLPDISSVHAYIQRQAAAWTCSVTLPYPDSYKGKKGPPQGPK